ncbi:transposase [Clostridium botulinum]|uniref:Transposase n=1 Tax=Clostridium botulinum TaxID=1491 RepID=A0A6B4JQP7_CLOBO|nr:transposase [Clostridium botulinum]EES48711.1 conserved hypothetical protein [Clostridium botulinum E1 str. 'BoNT E Beluga']MBN1066063.1 transposase [Clostridium botulinum]MBY6759435.1 transposase [Clostridium botulinum]MBY6918343.1 transposase [Clostridium botulinum]MCR1129427.1 transposase [Clostridium botulinum]
MSRKNREWYQNSIMHVTSRGNRRNYIFTEDKDYRVYINLIKECIEYFEGEFEVLGYTLMTNHIHLHIQTKKIHIGFFMKRLNNAYAKYFNKKYNYVGHLFQERYWSQVISNDIQMLETSKYIHLNPVRANMVKKPEEYKWSSYCVYIGKKKEKIVNCDMVLSFFRTENCRELYKNYVEG